MVGTGRPGPPARTQWLAAAGATLGWLFADEPVTPRALLACALIVGAVICALRQEAAHHEAENRSGVRKRSG